MVVSSIGGTAINGTLDPVAWSGTRLSVPYRKILMSMGRTMGQIFG